MNVIQVHARRKQLLARRNLRGSPGDSRERLRDVPRYTIAYHEQSPVSRSAIRPDPDPMPDDFPLAVLIAVWMLFLAGGVGVLWAAVQAARFVWTCARGGAC